MKYNTSLLTNALLCAGVLLPCLAQASSFVEDFESYPNGTILTERTSAGSESTYFDNWHTYNFFSGDRQLGVAAGSSGTGWDSGIGNFLGSSLEAIYYQDPGAGLTDVFASGTKFEINFTHKWNTGNGGMRIAFGNSTEKAFEFVNTVRDYTVTTGGVTYAVAGNEAPGQDTWMDVRFVVDVAANSGNGSISLLWRTHGATDWLTDAVFTEMNMQLLSTGVSDPETWSRLTLRLPGSGNSFGGITVAAIPEPTSAALLMGSAAMALPLVFSRAKVGRK